MDESFADVDPGALGLRAARDGPGLLVLRSFGKFYGLAGLRLGFALGAAADVGRLRAAAGPWPVSGPALAAGRIALADPGWARADARAGSPPGPRGSTRSPPAAGWQPCGGTSLFRLYDAGDAAAAQARLARGAHLVPNFPLLDPLDPAGAAGRGFGVGATGGRSRLRSELDGRLVLG